MGQTGIAESITREVVKQGREMNFLHQGYQWMESWWKRIDAANDLIQVLASFILLVDGCDGVIEEVGFRSTRVRRLTGHLVTVPNEKMAGNQVENIGKRPHIRRLTNITITYDMPVAKVEKAITIIRNILSNHPGMHPDFSPGFILTSSMTRH